MPPKGTRNNPNGRPKGTVGTKKVSLRQLTKPKNIFNTVEKKKEIAKNREKIKETIINALVRFNGYVDDACIEAGISQRTYTEWLKEDLEFADRCEHAKVAWLKKSEQRMIELGQVEKDGFLAFKANSFILEKKGRRIGYEKDSAPTQTTTLEIKMSDADTIALKALALQLVQEEPK